MTNCRVRIWGHARDTPVAPHDRECLLGGKKLGPSCGGHVGCVMDSGRGCSAGAGLCYCVLSRRCCQWAVSASSLIATSTRRPTAATSWGSALTCRSPPTCCPQVRPSPVGPSPALQGSEVELRLSHGSEDAVCSSRRTSFPSGFGPRFSVFKTGEGWTEQPLRVAYWVWFSVEGRLESREWKQHRWVSEVCRVITLS